MRRVLSIILSLSFIFPAAASENLQTRKCGEFELITETLEDFSPEACRLDDGEEDRDYKTRGARTKIHLSEREFNLSKNVGEAVDRVLLDLMRKKVRARFADKLKTIDLGNEKSFHEAYLQMQEKILDDGKSPKSQVRKLFILFPDLEQEILKDHPDYKPLICRYEVWKHNQKILKNVALGLSVLQLAALMTAAPIAASVVFTANMDRAFLVSQILIGGGVAGVVGGALQIRNDIANWDQVTAAKNAKMLLKFYGDIDKEIKKLQKDPEKNRAKIVELEKWLPTSVELEQLKQTKKKEFKEYKSLFFGLAKVGLGVTMIYGGQQLFEMLSQFEAGAPASDPTGGSVAPPWMN